jgi:hypothetical protein
LGELEVSNHTAADISPGPERKDGELVAVGDRPRELSVQIRLEWIRIVLSEDKDSQVFAPAAPRIASTARAMQAPMFENGPMPPGISYGILS